MFGITVPSGFGRDFAGVVDEVGAGAEGFVVGDRVCGGALAKAAADFVVMKATAAQRERLSGSATTWFIAPNWSVPVGGMTIRAVWSTGEVVGVAALLCDNDILGELDETLQSVWARWAGGFWLPCPQLSKVDMANY
jgi:NADPH:quinone reductase-like Zn-dependent oxidoreductase